MLRADFLSYLSPRLGLADPHEARRPYRLENQNHDK